MWRWKVNYHVTDAIDSMDDYEGDLWTKNDATEMMLGAKRQCGGHPWPRSRSSGKLVGIDCPNMPTDLLILFIKSRPHREPKA
jgi:hypothetical protein